MNLPVILALAVATAAAQGTVNWPAFRGADADGVAEAKIVSSWNADPAEGAPRNVRWSTPIPGLSHSSPIIWRIVYLSPAQSAQLVKPA